LQTSTILDTFRQAAYFPIMAGEAKARDSSNQPFVRHIIQFCSLQNILRPNVLKRKKQKRFNKMLSSVYLVVFMTFYKYCLQYIKWFKANRP